MCKGEFIYVYSLKRVRRTHLNEYTVLTSVSTRTYNNEYDVLTKVFTRI